MKTTKEKIAEAMYAKAPINHVRMVPTTRIEPAYEEVLFSYTYEEAREIEPNYIRTLEKKAQAALDVVLEELEQMASAIKVSASKINKDIGEVQSFTIRAAADKLRG